VVTAPAKRELVRFMSRWGLSERRSLRVVKMSASALRYTSVPDRKVALRAEIVRLAQRYRRYGGG
jgi:putative transposase